MAISLLTDSERKVYDEVKANAGHSTMRRLEALMVKSRVTEIPQVIEDLRREIIERRRNDPPPYDGVEKRFAEQMNRIEENTADMPWLSRWLSNVFKFGGNEAEKKYPSRSKR